MYSKSLLINWTKWLFWVAVIALIAVFVGSGFFIYQYLQSRGLSMEINGPTEINIGVPFDLTVNFSNQSRNVLKNAQLTLNLPIGAVVLGASEEQRIFTEDLGDIGVGSLSQKSFRLLIIKDENTVKQFRASIAYGASGIGQARFEEHQDFDLRINPAAVSLDLTPPDQVLSGTKFDLKIDYRNLSQETFSGLELQLGYPASFSFDSAKPKPSTDNNVWTLKDLSPNSDGNIIVSGSLIGPNNSFFNFDAKLYMNILGHRYLINQKSGSVAISPSPLELSLSLNEQDNYVASLGDQLVYAVIYKNNSGVGLADVVIKVKLMGDLYDFNTLQSKANFNSITNTLTWNASNLSELKLLAVGDSGMVIFQIRVKNQFPIRRLGDKNFTLKTEAEISSPTVPYYLSATQTTGLANLETKIAGATKIETKAYFRDAASGLANYGPWPPKVNQPTQYTVHWLVTNYSTDIRNVEIRAFLESGVTWTGKVKGNAGSLPTYNDRTQEVVWTIDKIPATKGVISSPLEVVFQIQATPNITQVGNYQPLIKETYITALDDFTGTRLQNQAAAVTTVLPDDPTVSQTLGIVAQ
jgi:hypothetical protein